jgi:D-aminoacyl-tRNA deacylase
MITGSMDLILFSTDDSASMNIFRHLESMCNLKMEMKNIYSCGKYFFAIIDMEKIHAEGIDDEIQKKINERIEKVIVASKHKSESGMKSLTVHPIGNFSRAEMGGRDRTLVNVPSRSMTGALLKLIELNTLEDFSINFEVTHHGPYMERPVFFIEIGSNEDEWINDEAGEIIAKTILSYEETNDPVAVGIGGGHYAPRFTRLALERKISFGHMAPKYAIDNLDLELLIQMEKKSNAKYVIMEKKDLSSKQRKRIMDILPSTHLEPLDPDSLELR